MRRLLKGVESRGWGTSYRGPVAILASKLSTKDQREAAHPDYVLELLTRIGREDDLDAFVNAMVFGAAVAVGELVDCFQVRALNPLSNEPIVQVVGTDGRVRDLSAAEDKLGDISPGRFAWIFRDVRPFATPVPIRGKQGLFELCTADEAAIRGELARSPAPAGARS